MKKSNKFSPEVRHADSAHGAGAPWRVPITESIAPKIGCVPQTLNEWVKRDEVDTGTRAGTITSEHERVKALERGGKELRRANEILKLACAVL